MPSAIIKAEKQYMKGGLKHEDVTEKDTHKDWLDYQDSGDHYGDPHTDHMDTG